MKALNGKDLLQALTDLQKQGCDLAKVSIYIGDDEELNGVHMAFFCNTYNDTDENFNELLDECGYEIKFKGKAILLS